MFHPLTSQLLLMALTIAAFGIWLSSRYLSLAPAILIPVVRLSIPFLYFSLGFGGRWTFIDDLFYTDTSGSLLSQGWTPLTILFTPAGQRDIFLAAGGQHIFYIWWNMVAQTLFGNSYAAPVFLNTGVLFIAAWLLGRLCESSNCSKAYTAGLYCYIIFQPELLVWTSFLNLKDVLVMALTLVLCYAVTRICQGARFSAFALIAGAVFVLFYIRFYVPVLFAAALVAWLFLVRFRGRRGRLLVRALLIVGAVTAIAVLIPSIRNVLLMLSAVSGAESGSTYGTWLKFSIGGSLQWLATPRPWAVLPEYSFLNLPAIYHWVLLLPAIVVAPRLFRSSQPAALCILYFLVTAAFYGAYEELRGPRHRLQVEFITSWMEYHALWLIARGVRLRGPLPSPVISWNGNSGLATT